MDRLICGDVGYGKTEIAVRAAFKAVQDGKQVAVLVPDDAAGRSSTCRPSPSATRRSRSSCARSRGSRATRRRKEVHRGPAPGSVDVVIGTHRLLPSEVSSRISDWSSSTRSSASAWSTRSSSRQMRTAVDVLAMSATPIPRTLEMAVTGIREMSTLATPPEERHPVLTYVGAYEEKQIVAAIRRELMREGQVFFVHNKVSSIERAARGCASSCRRRGSRRRTARWASSGWRRSSRTSGTRSSTSWSAPRSSRPGWTSPTPTPSIVERADTFGLCQLHQLRGRVGRGRERAYAYFLYPPEKPLTETAHDRLKTIAEPHRPRLPACRWP